MITPEAVKAILARAGVRTSHSSILARPLGIPAVVGVEGLLDIVGDGMVDAVDGDEGDCELKPSSDVKSSFAATAPTHSGPVLHPRHGTVDGVEVHVLANARRRRPDYRGRRFRTLDVGGDKNASLLGLEKEVNPFLGVGEFASPSLAQSCSRLSFVP